MRCRKYFVISRIWSKIKILRSDNVLEFCNAELRQIYEGSGIVHQTSASYSPEQNGKAERMNRTLVGKARSMLFEANLGKSYWAEAPYLLNVTPRNIFKYKSPEEIWTGKTIDLSHLRVFGCVGMVLVPKELRQKWDPKSKKCIMNYRMYDPENRKEEKKSQH